MCMPWVSSVVWRHFTCLLKAFRISALIVSSDTASNRCLCILLVSAFLECRSISLNGGNTQRCKQSSHNGCVEIFPSSACTPILYMYIYICISGFARYLRFLAWLHLNCVYPLPCGVWVLFPVSSPWVNTYVEVHGSSGLRVYLGHEACFSYVFRHLLVLFFFGRERGRRELCGGRVASLVYRTSAWPRIRLTAYRHAWCCGLAWLMARVTDDGRLHDAAHFTTRHKDTQAERQRRWTAKPIRSPRVGSMTKSLQ